MNVNKLLFAVAIALTTSLSAHALTADTSVSFPIGQKNGSFNCTFNGSGTVKFTTDDVKVKGFCAGDPGVTIPGQLERNSGDVQDYYFSISKSASKSGKINVISLDGDIQAITCNPDKGPKKPYPGNKYC
jgi:hypothetical protein